jgi:hypothetical protein
MFIRLFISQIIRSEIILFSPLSLPPFLSPLLDIAMW